ncbi:uncharacterized protein LOC141679194 [Apium graveolens]|uniref:uncharacterized protein LOC141679194 n=1 Tax=Apium graveolens TaxID=4045 RepID=UPI003D79E378
MDFQEWMARFLSDQTVQNKVKCVTVCWAIWRARNDLVWSNKRWSSLKIVAKAWEYLSQWTVAQERFYNIPSQPSVPGDGAIFWARPQPNEVKITVDAAIFEEQGTSGLGVMARNHEGHLLVARTRVFNEVLQPTLAEALAIKEALSWTKEWTGDAIVIESDCLVVLQLIRSATPMRSRLGKVIDDCRRLVCEHNNVKLYFIKRSANMSAHELAHASHMYPDHDFDWSYVPVKVRQCILNDLLK